MRNKQILKVTANQLSIFNTVTKQTTKPTEETKPTNEVYEALAYERARYPFGYGSSFML